MKTLASALTMLAFVAGAQAADMGMGDSTGMPSDTSGQTMTASPAPVPVQGAVARAAITKGIEDREPIDNLAEVTTDTDKVYYFTELRDMEGQTVTHRWEYNGETMAEVAFDVGGPRWRVYSSKNLMPEWTGQWRVSVVDAAGNIVRGDTFMYTDAPAMSSGMSQHTMTGTDGMNAATTGSR